MKRFSSFLIAGVATGVVCFGSHLLITNYSDLLPLPIARHVLPPDEYFVLEVARGAGSNDEVRQKLVTIYRRTGWVGAEPTLADQINTRSMLKVARWRKMPPAELFQLYFVAAEIDSRHDEQFERLADQLASRADSDLQAQVALLRFLHAHDFATEPTEDYYRELAEFGQQHQGSRWGIELFTNSAAQLQRFGRREAAERTLQIGEVFYPNQTTNATLQQELGGVPLRKRSA